MILGRRCGPFHQQEQETEVISVNPPRQEGLTLIIPLQWTRKRTKYISQPESQMNIIICCEQF